MPSEQHFSHSSAQAKVVASNSAQNFPTDIGKHEGVLVGHVRLRINASSWELGQGNLEPLLDHLENLLIRFTAHEADTQTLRTEATSTSNTMQVAVGIAGQVVVDGKVDALDIDTTPEDVSCNTDTLVEVFELLVTLDTRGQCKSIFEQICISFQHTVLLG